MLFLLATGSGLLLGSDPVAPQGHPALPHGASVAAPSRTSSTDSAAPHTAAAQTSITFYTTPDNCGGITFNGSNWADLQAGNFPQGTYAVSATPCASWYLVSLKGGGAVSIAGNTATVTAGTGTVSAVFSGYAYTIAFATLPTTCGSVDFNGTPYMDGASTTSSPGDFPVAATPCPGYYTTSIKGTGGVTVTGSTADVTGNGTIAATFQPKSVNLTVASDPSDCGGVLVGTTGVASGTTKAISAGNYQYKTWACVGYVLSGIYGDANVTVTPWINGPQNGTVEIIGDGTITLLWGLEIFNVTFITEVIGEPGQNGGTIQFQGQTFTNGTTAQFPAFTNGTVNVTAYPNYEPSGFPLNISGGVHWNAYEISVFINGSGEIIAYFLPIHYYVQFTTDQSACTATTIDFNDSVYALIDYYGPRLLVGTYLISSPACTGFSFDGYSAETPRVVGVSHWSGIVWVNGSGVISVNFVPNWILVSGVVENYLTGDPLAGATVFISYGGQEVNQTPATGHSGNWSLRLTYGGYNVNATAPYYSTSPTQTFFVNGTPTGVRGYIVWLNATLGLPTTPTGLVGFVSTYPGILVPVGLVVASIAVILVVQMSFKWSEIERENRRNARRGGGGPPPGLGPYGGPSQLPTPGMARPTPQLPAGPGAPPPGVGMQGLPPTTGGR